MIADEARSIVRFLLLLIVSALASPASAQPTRLAVAGKTVELQVDGRPFLILGGELSNSAASSAEYMQPIWPRLRAMNLNTVLAPVSWELVEPIEGKFDFSSVDHLIEGARKNDLRLVLLWFGAWKNSMSTYVPAWVKRDQKRFERATLPDGSGVDILSAFSRNALSSDARAFAALIHHVKRVDGQAGTVLMVQVENEIGMLPVARERGSTAQWAFDGPVPTELMRYLTARRDRLQPELAALWRANGSRPSGTWAQIFGSGPAGEEVFTAWHYARFADALARAGKARYDLPMFVNVALNRPGKAPGEYPSGGPLPHLIDVWKAGAPSIDMISPDIYFPNFEQLVARYNVPGNAVFVPEANRADRSDLGANAIVTFGEYRAIGFSPFSIDSAPPSALASVTRLYAMLGSIAPLISEAQRSGAIRGVKAPMAFDGSIDDKPRRFALGDYAWTANMVDMWTSRDQQEIGDHGALVIQLGPEDYLVAGQGVIFTLEPVGKGGRKVGIESAWEGRFDNGQWKPGRLLNGDETHQGRHVRLPPGSWSMQRVKLYRYN